MNIVHVITRLIVGGAQENTLLSCEGQHAAGHRVTLLTGPPLGPEGSLMERAASAGYRVQVIDAMRRSILPGKDWRTYRELVAAFRQIKPDVVHTHSSKAGIIGRHAARAADIPAIVHTIHGLSFTSSKSAIVNGLYKWLERRAARVSDKIVCVADEMARISLAAGIGRPEQYVTIFSGMDTAPFVQSAQTRDEIRRQYAIADTDIVVGTIARLFHMKGHDDLLDHAPALCTKHPNLKFMWVGDGLLRPAFEQRIAAMSLQSRFILTGLVRPDQVPPLCGAMDILAHPSRREGLARALPQAQLAGKPVVTYDIDGNREGLISDETGFLIAPFDAGKLCQCLEVLIEDAGMRRRMGRSGQAFALRRFDTAVMVRRLNELYEQLLANKPAR